MSTASSPKSDQVLTEIRSGRRLEKIVTSIESFLDNQLAKLEQVLVEIESAANKDRIVQKILADFELEKQAWEQERDAEILRLSKAGEELIEAWEKLENERKTWLDDQSS